MAPVGTPRPPLDSNEAPDEADTGEEPKAEEKQDLANHPIRESDAPVPP